MHRPALDDDAETGTELDHDVVEEIGRAMGVIYCEDEQLKIGPKEAERDHHRWELDPASSEDYRQRLHDLDGGPADKVLAMTHSHHR
jgi:hypothetical protein